MTRSFPFLPALVLMLFALLWVGCADHGVPSTSTGHTDSPQGASPAADRAGTKPASQSADARPSEAGQVRVIDEGDLAKTIAARKGRVVLVDFWATWCSPCLELLPHTVQLRRDLAGKGFDVILVSLDDPDNEAQVVRALASKGVTFESFLSRYGTSPKSMEAMAIPDGSLPHLKLYDRQGAVRREFSAGNFKPAQIDHAVSELLGTP
jgi:thiol-disulfide isomerase/thioredoxin